MILTDKTLVEIGELLFNIAKRNDENEQWKIHQIYNELIRRDNQKVVENV